MSSLLLEVKEAVLLFLRAKVDVPTPPPVVCAGAGRCGCRSIMMGCRCCSKRCGSAGCLMYPYLSETPKVAESVWRWRHKV